MSTRIKGTDVWMEDMRLARAYRIAGEEITHAESAFFLIHHESGAYGLGAASPMPEICGESMSDTFTALHGAANLLTHADFSSLWSLTSQIERAFHSTPAACAAVDMALYDLHCKLLGISVVDFLGRRHQELETSVTIGITNDQQVHEELRLHLQQGFQTIKVKIGDNVDRDIAIVNKLREWGGSQFRLRVDANEGYDLVALTRFLTETATLNIELIEQPLDSPGAMRMRSLSSELRLRCMADEDLLTEQDALALSEDPPYGVWNIKLMKSGGITPAKRIAVLAQQAGISLMWGCNDESRVSIAAALHVAYSCPATKYLDLDGSFDIEHDIVGGGFTLENGRLRLTDAPGLGIFLL